MEHSYPSASPIRKFAIAVGSLAAMSLVIGCFGPAPIGFVETASHSMWIRNGYQMVKSTIGSAELQGIDRIVVPTGTKVSRHDLREVRILGRRGTCFAGVPPGTIDSAANIPDIHLCYSSMHGEIVIAPVGVITLDPDWELYFDLDVVAPRSITVVEEDVGAYSLDKMRLPDSIKTKGKRHWKRLPLTPVVEGP